MKAFVRRARSGWLVLLVLLAGACAREAGEALPEEAGPEPAAPAAAETLRTPLVPGDSLVRPAGDSLALSAADSLQAGLAELMAAFQVLQRENDSLKAAVAELSADAPDTAAVRIVQVPANAEETIKEAGESIRNFGLRMFLAVVVLVLIFFLIRGTIYALEKLSEQSAERRLFYKRLVPIARIFLWALAIYLILRVIFNLTPQSLVAAAAAIGVAIGFAAQDILKNIFGGLVIIFDQPFQVGDKIEVGGTYGEVSSIGLRSTRIVTPDDNLVSVPNSQVVDSQVSNANAGALDCQVVTHLYLPGWVDEERAKKIAYQAAASSKYVFLQKPIVVIVLDEFKETFLTHLKVKAYVLDTRYEFLLMSDITERARIEFRRQGLIQPVHGALAKDDFDALEQTNPPANGDGHA